MKKSLLLMLALVFSLLTMGQSTANYAFSYGNTGSLEDMSTGATSFVGSGTIVSGYNDDNATALTNIGFTFYFMGVPYTQFSANSNGQIRLGSAIGGSNVSSYSLGVNTIAAMAGDNACQGIMSYKLKGTAPNRILVVEWKSFVVPYSSTTTNYGDMQTWLYENGTINFIYGSLFNNAASATSRGIFISNSNTAGASGSVTVGATPTFETSATTPVSNSFAASALIANLGSSAQGSRIFYTFAPSAVAPADPINLNFTSVTTTGMTVNWTDNSTNEVAFYLSRALDAGFTTGVVNTLIASTTSAGTGTSYNSVLTGLVPGSTYYFKVIATSEGLGSTPGLAGSNAAASPGIVQSIASGNWSNTATWSTGIVPTATDNVIISDGHTVVIDATGQTCYNLTVGQGTSGILRFGTTAATFTVNASVNVQSGAIFDAGAAAGASLSHSLYIGGSTASSAYTGNLSVYGTFNMWIGASNGKATVTFYGIPNTSISGTGSINFYQVVMNKGAVTATSTVTPPVMELLTPVNGSGSATTGFISTHTAGVFKIGGSFSQTNPIYTTVGYTIAGTGGIWLNNPNFIVSGLNGSPTVTGLFKVSTGTYNIGTAAGNSMGSGSNGVFIIEGGTVNVAGRFNLTSSGVYYNQSNGTVTVCTVGNTSTTTASFGITSSTSTSFIMTGGKIAIQLASTGATPYDYYVNAATVNVTNGVLQFGNASSGAAKTFALYGKAPNVVLDITSANHSLKLAGASIVFGDLTFNGTGTFTGTGQSLTMTGNSVYSGNIYVPAGFTFTGNASSSALVFNSSTGNQVFSNLGTITGTSSTGNLYNLTINNTYNSGAGTVTIPDGLYMAGGATLTLTKGILTVPTALTLGTAGTTGFTFIKGDGSVSIAPALNYGTGTVNYTYNGTTPQTTGSEIPATITGALTINNATGVTLGAALNTGTLAFTTGKLTTSASNLLTVTGSTASSVTGGSVTNFVAGPLARTIPAALATGTTYAFPLGKSGYNLFELVNPVTAAGSPMVIQAEVFDADCGGTAGTNMSALNTNRYWSASFVSGGTNFTSTTVRLTESGMNSNTGMGKSLTQTGAYNLVSAAVPSTTIISTSLTDLGYFCIGTKNVPMFYISSTVTQASTSTVLQNSTNQAILGMQVVTDGNTSPLSVTKFTVSGNGTTAAGDISNARVWYTGNTSTFAATTQFGTDVASPTLTSFDITGSQALAVGTNYFWLTYDIPLTATSTHVVDGECTVITVGGVDKTPTATAPTGSRTIFLNPPTALTATVISAAEIDLTWTKNSVGQDVMVATNSTSTFGTPVNGTAYAVNDPITGGGTILYKGPLAAFNHTLLTSNTSYYYKAWSVDASNYYSTGATANAKTPCTSYSLPVVEGFNAASTIPGCWSQQNVTYSVSFTYPTSGTGTPTNTAYEGARELMFNSYSNSGAQTRLVSPPITTTGISSVDVIFAWYFSTNGGATTYLTEGVIVQYSTNGTTWTDATPLIRRYGPTTGWALQTVTLPAGAGNQAAVYVGFLFTSNAGYDSYLDGIDIHQTPSCPPPTALTATSITNTNATIGWTAGGTETNWEYSIGTSPLPAPTGSGTAATSTSVPVNGLSSNTVYQFYVRANCVSGGIFSTWAGPYTFRTLCDVTSTLPYSQNFETVTPPALPECTTSQNAGAGNNWVTVNNPGYGFTTKVLEYVYNSSNPANAWFYTQGINLTGGVSYRLTFKYGNNSTGYIEKLKVWYGTSAVNTAMTNPIVDYPTINQGAPQSSISDFTPGSNGTYYIGFNCYSASNQWDLFVDDIVLDVTPLCPPPSTLYATDITNTGASIGWTAGGTESNWEYSVGVSPLPAPTDPGTATSSNPTTISGLTGNTAYQFYVRANCGSGSLSTWAGPYSFKTACDPSTDVTELFDGVTAPAMPNCWSKWTSPSYTSQYVQTYATSPNSTPNCVVLYSSSASLAADAPLLISPKITNLAAGTHELRFFAKGASSNVSVIVGTMSDPANAATFTPLQTVTGLSTSAWTEEIVSFAGYSGTDHYIAFRHPVTTTYSYIYIDNVYWETTPTCPKPTGLVVEAGNTFANLSWNSGGSESLWNIEYGPSGFTQGTGTMITDVATNSYQITGLTPSTAYSFYVQANCGGGDLSAWTGPKTFTTLIACPAPTDLTAKNVTTTSASLRWKYMGTSTTFNIDWALSGVAQGAGTIVNGVTMPYQLDGLASGYTYRFYVQADCGSGTTSTWAGPYTFKTLCDIISTFPWNEGFEGLTTVGSKILPVCWGYANVVGTSGPTSSATSGTYNGPHNGTNYVYTTYNNQTWIFTPAMQLSAGISYDFSFWMVNKYPTDPLDFSMDVAYGATQDVAGMTNMLATGISCANNTYQRFIYSFTPATAGVYYFGVQTTSPSSTPWYISFDDFTFQPTPPCVEPTDLTVTNITSSTATVAWAGATSVLIDYGAYGHTAGAGTIIPSTSTNPYMLTGLTSNYHYDVYVRQDCGGGTLSPWYGPVSFWTGCETMSEMSQNFDGIPASTLPNCWSKYVSPNFTSQYVYATTTSPHSTPNCAVIYSSGATTSTDAPMLITPQLSGMNTGDHWLRFWAKGSSTNTSVIVGTMSDPTNNATFTPFATITGLSTTAWTSEVVNFSTYTGSDQYIAFQHPVTATYYYVYIDNVVWQPVPSCMWPNNVTATNITATSANISWTDASTVDVDFGTVGHTAGTGTVASAVTTNPYTIGPLTSHTSYDVYVRKDCGSGTYSEWTGPVTFTTPCASYALPFCEAFANSTLPGCWSNQMTGAYTTEHWSLQSTTNAGGAAYEARAYWSPNQGTLETDQDRLVTPPVNVTGIGAVKVSFKQMLDDYNAGVNDVWVKVQYSTDATTWTDAWSYAAGLGVDIPAGTTSLLIPVPPATTQMYFAWTLAGKAYDLNDWYVDNICITEALAHDVAVSSIDMLPLVVPTTPVIPTASVINNGGNTETFNVTMTMNNGYTSTKTVTALDPGTGTTVTFDSWTPSIGTWTVQVCAELGTDMNTTNDCASQPQYVKNPTKVYAYNAYDPTEVLPNGPVYFNDVTPGTITSLATGTAEMFIEASAWVNGTWYGSDYYDDDPDSYTYGEGGGWYTINPTTGAMTLVANLGKSFTGIAYDPTNSILYGVAYNSSGSNDLYTIVPATGAATLIGTILPDELLIDLGFAADGYLYSVGIGSDHLFKINPTTHATTDLGACGWNFNYAQGMGYNFNSGIMYIAGYTTGGKFMIANLNNGAAYLEGNFQGDAEIDGVAVPYSSAKMLNITQTYLEGMYTGEGTMRQASNCEGPQFLADTADVFTVELHNAIDYATIEYSVTVGLSTGGSASVEIPSDKNGSYYLTIRHRNSIETTSASPVDFSGASIDYSFNPQSQAYGDNQQLMADGTAALFTGDPTQEGLVDSDDLAAIGNLAAWAECGYLSEDLTGDGLVDSDDLAACGNNAAWAIGVILPF
jgi:hypothetical protein